MSDFIFNGVSAESMGLRIERYPIIRKPRKRITPVTIAGRNGNLHISDRKSTRLNSSHLR